MMKKCFERTGSAIKLVDKEKMIFAVEDENFVDIKGRSISSDEKYRIHHVDEDECLCCSDDAWDAPWADHEGLDEKLMLFYTKKVNKGSVLNDRGCFGYKNREGKVIIEAQYEEANQFTYGLAAVNLCTTWFTTDEGHWFYENHYGYIDHHGVTVIPFIFDEAYPFNQYGLAVVTYRDKIGRLIDREGNIVAGSEKLDFLHCGDYESRYFEFVYADKGNYDARPLGLYDTKERKVIREPGEEVEKPVVVPHGEQIYRLDPRAECFASHLEELGFDDITLPNRSMLAIVGKRGRYTHQRKYGVYASNERFALPMKYEKITEVAENVFACWRNGAISVFRYKEKETK